MAIKESYAYEVLFAKSKLYGIIYFVLSTIGLLVIISCLRDTVGEDLFFNRMVILGTFFVLFILVLIASLFRSIINFTNVNAIDKIYRDYLMIQEKKNLLAASRVKYSSDQFKNLLATYKATEYTFSYAFNDAPLSFSMSVIDDDNAPPIDEQRLQVVDINMTQLAHFMDEKKKEGQILFQHLQLDALTSKSDNYIWVRGRSNTEKDKKILKSSLKLRPVKATLVETQLNARKYFDEKLKERTEEGKKGIEQILDSYLDMYTLEMKNSGK